jgi:ATP-dependent helicase HrpB
MNVLPIDSMLPDVLATVRSARSLVLVAPPGSGKTTRVPPALLRAGILSERNPSIVLLQPRRVAARAAAQRIADENGWSVGREVGYQIRFEKKIGLNTRLKVETEGILNRQLVADPFLEGVGAVILDEFHERSLHTDLAMALLKEVRETVREELILIVMSATLDAGPVARFLGDCPIIEAKGRTFPVEITYRPTLKPAAAESVAAAVEETLKDGNESGHVLVFLPGAEEIRRAAWMLESLAARENLLVMPLHGSLPGEEQDRALRPSERRKVILATNVAETSLTIDGVTTVIDSGLARFASDDPARGLNRLELGRISRASAAQRAGRAGRTAPGRCLRLWSEREQRGMIENDPPEVARVDLAATVLTLHAWGATDPARFDWFESPPIQRLAAAERLLGLLGALDEEKKLTPLGRRLLAVPTHPRIARLLLAAAEEGHARAGAALAAILSEPDFVRLDPGSAQRGSSDLLARLDRLNEAEARRFAPLLRERGIDPNAARRVARARDDLARSTRHIHTHQESEPDEETMLRWVLLAYPDRVVRRRGSELTGVMVGGRGVRLDGSSIVREEEFFLALDPREDRRGAGAATEAKVRLASAIRVEWLEELFPDALRRARTARFDEERQRAIGVSSVWYRDLLIREDRQASLTPAEASAALAEALAANALAFVHTDEAAAAWLARLAFVRKAFPEADWPALDDDETALAEIVADACAGKRTVDEARAVPLVPLLRARLEYVQSRTLDEMAPEALAVPSGNRIRLIYEPGRPPVLAVRLQELFGLAETPRVAGGRVPVLLHLLGPNYRPVQVTDDLASFWASTYFQVRKDLRARYPRHAWPDDPHIARAEAKGGRRS